MNLYRFILIFLTFIFQIKLSSCGTYTCDGMVLPDLIVKRFILPSVLVFGSETSFTLEILNEIEDSNRDCTMEAVETKYLWKFSKKNKDTNEFEVITINEKSQESIIAGDVIDESIDLTIPKQGSYKLEILIDSPDFVKERSESNNSLEVTIGHKSAINNDDDNFEHLEKHEKTNNYISINFEVIQTEGNTAKIIVID